MATAAIGTTGGEERQDSLYESIADTGEGQAEDGVVARAAVVPEAVTAASGTTEERQYALERRRQQQGAKQLEQKWRKLWNMLGAVLAVTAGRTAAVDVVAVAAALAIVCRLLWLLVVSAAFYSRKRRGWSRRNCVLLLRLLFLMDCLVFHYLNLVFLSLKGLVDGVFLFYSGGGSHAFHLACQSPSLPRKYADCC